MDDLDEEKQWKIKHFSFSTNHATWPQVAISGDGEEGKVVNIRRKEVWGLPFTPQLKVARQASQELPTSTYLLPPSSAHRCKWSWPRPPCWDHRAPRGSWGWANDANRASSCGNVTRCLGFWRIFNDSFFSLVTSDSSTHPSKLTSSFTWISSGAAKAAW